MAKGAVDKQNSAAKPKLSGLESIKEAGRQLRGTLGEALGTDTDHFSEADKQLLKFHGSYQQEDRDARKERRKQGLGKHYMFMVRCKIPGGKLTAQQFLAVDDIAEKHANGTIRITSRQGLQLHGVLKTDLKETLRAINDSLLTTLGACGDVNRNVMVCPAPLGDGLHAQLQRVGDRLAERFAPQSRAYHEIWLNGKSVPFQQEEESKDVEPIYGKVYLPRKFKIGLALPENNLIDIYTQDLGLLAIVDNDQIVGYNLLVGGGMGRTPNNADTFPHLAQPIGYVPADEVAAAAEAVVKLFRDHGNRENRKRARIKYLVHDWGVDKFRDVLAGYVGHELAPAKPAKAKAFDLLLGWQPQGDGKYWYGLSVQSGRIKDDGDFRLRTALRKIVEKFQPDIRLTPMQDILLCGLKEKTRERIDKILRKHGVIRPLELPLIQRLSMSCPAIPTCGLAISESERALPALTAQLDAALRQLGLEKEEIAVRVTGCPNGCARPYNCDIGIVGRSGTKYSIFLGGNVVGDRLNFLFRDLVPFEEIVPTLTPLLADFKENRQRRESFGDFCQRLGVDGLVELLPEDRRQPPKSPKKNETTPKPNYRLPVEIERKDEKLNGAPRTASESAVDARPKTLEENTQIEEEVFLAGPAGAEVEDFCYLHDGNGKVAETAVYFYGEDRRAADALPWDPLVREAVYSGKIEPDRLPASRKTREVLYSGEKDYELADREIEYEDGQPLRTTVYYYQGNRRAGESPYGASLVRRVVYKGEVDC